ncbi:MAG: polyisoprenoid-binding protein [Proteobacteria bacterium]|nr:polyisoprenoid-binding protein [Burkholderiales bacterium]
MRLRPRLSTLLLCTFCGIGYNNAALAADSYTLDPGHTFPRWQVDHFGFSTHHGQFNKTTGKLVLDAKAGTGSLDVTVDAASVATGDPALEKHLRAADFFDVQKFPTLTFKSKSMKFDGGKPVSVSGDFTLLGVTRPITFQIVRSNCAMHPIVKKAACGAQVEGTLKRSDFGMKFGVPGLGDEIRLSIQVEAIKD